VAFGVQQSDDASFHVELRNSATKYEPAELAFDANTALEIDNSVLKWSNYVAAGFEVVRRDLLPSLPKPVKISL
jgi:hypothetical protein